jgi:transposase
MSKNRVIVLAVTHQNLSVSEVARKYKVSRQWIYKLLARHEFGGLKAVENASKRPKSNPNTTSPEVQQAIIDLRGSLAEQGLDNGAHTIAWHLTEQGLKTPATSTIWRILKNAGLVQPQPKKKPHAYILNWLDDHSRFLLSCKAFKPVTGVDVVETFKECVNEHGLPASTLTDNGSVYTARFVKGRNQFEYLIRSLGVQQKNGAPGRPTTQGKIERFHQTQKRWLGNQPKANTIQDLQQQLDQFSHIYNNLRPHSALEQRTTPLKAYYSRPKATAEKLGTSEHFRIRFDKVDKFGKLTLRRKGTIHHLGIGIKNAGTYVMMLVDETDVTVTNSVTGEVLSTHVIDDNHNYWPKQEGY